MCTFDIKENEGKGDELKSEEANLAQDKQGAEYETETPGPSPNDNLNYGKEYVSHPFNAEAALNTTKSALHISLSSNEINGYPINNKGSL